jgi:phage host-nuclease inhibitor protein Gam
MGDATFLKDDFIDTSEAALRQEVFRLRTAEKKWLEGQDTLAQALARYAAENEHLKKQVQSLQDYANTQLQAIRDLKVERYQLQQHVLELTRYKYQENKED